MLMNEHDRSNAEGFWAWIADNVADLRGAGKEAAGGVLDQAAQVLHRYDPFLGFEISQCNDSIELTVTAYGREQSFDSVTKLVESCPTIPGVRVFAFRQPEGPDFELEIAGRTFSPANVYFEPMKGKADPTSAGLQVFFARGDDIPIAERLHVAQIMLQAILGEYEATTRIDHLEVGDVGETDVALYIPLSDISAYLSWFERRNTRTTQ